jgi:hypothetical protein
MFVAVLLGPPVAFLLLPKRAFLSWQLFIVAAALSAAYTDRGQDPIDSVWVPALMGWAAFSLFFPGRLYWAVAPSVHKNKAIAAHPQQQCISERVCSYF